MEPQFNGQLMQDKIVWEAFFQNLQNGTYVDIGASDGITISNTKFYDDIGWSGICVEPIPDVYRKLCFNRPNAITVWGAAYNRDGTETFRANTGYTAELSGIESAYDPRHIQRIEYEQQQHGGITEMIEVPTFTITSLLRKHKINKVDYMSIDVEGSELQVLQGIDFDSLQIRVISIEDNYKNEAAYDDLLLSKGYKKLMRVEWDLVYYLISAFPKMD